jgi:NADH dehydrogenase
VTDVAARLVVTGANGALGASVLERGAAREGVELVALARAGAALPLPRSERVRAVLVDWKNPESLAAGCAGASALIHLAGILIETPEKGYQAANVATTRLALAAARAAGVKKFVLVSAVFADPNATNAYWRSKGEAEELVRASGLPYTILRCPLVLACKSEGAHAIAREAMAPWVVPLPGGGTNLEQPIDARDVADGALAAALDPECARDLTLDLVGPESLPARELVRRAARLRKRAPSVLSVPVAWVRGALELKCKWVAPTGFSPTVLEVLLADTRFDPLPAAKALGLELRSLDEMLEETLRLEGFP